MCINNKMGYIKNVVLLLMVTSIMQCVTCVRIGAFNIQVFGKSKASKQDVMDILVGVISRYDLVLIQEIRDSSGVSIKTLLDNTNAANKQNPFKMSLSDRLGRTNSKEQYAFFYRPTAFTVLDQYHYDDGDETLNSGSNTVDKFQREPYVILVESKLTEIKKFAIAGIHVDPDEAVDELKHLQHVFDNIKSKFNVNDVIVMGDLNADCSYVPKYKWEEIPLKTSPEYDWLITDDIDTTVSGSDCAYDRFIITGNTLRDNVVPSSARVFLFDSHYELDSTRAKAVSDHYPVEFELKVSTSGSSYTGLTVCITVLCSILSIVVRNMLKN